MWERGHVQGNCCNILPVEQQGKITTEIFKEEFK